MKYLIVVALFFIAGCHSEKEKRKVEAGEQAVARDSSKSEPDSGKIAPAVAVVKMNFFDSIVRRLKLSANQMRAHTNIDSVFYTPSGDDPDFMRRPGFDGDSIIKFTNGITGALLHYNDGSNCSYEWLFLYRPDSTINSGEMYIEISCDRDPGFDYYYTRYRLLNDSMFETKEYHIPPNHDDDFDGKLWERKKYKVSSTGRFETVQSWEYHK